MWLEASAVTRDDRRAVEDHHLVVGNQHLHRSMHESMRHAVADRFDVDETVARNSAANAMLANRNTALGQSAKRRPLDVFESIAWSLVRRAVDACIGFDHPTLEMRFERLEAQEREPGDR